MTAFARERRRRLTDRRPRWFEIPENVPENYNRSAIMYRIDSMDPEWRELVNEYGFQATQIAMSQARNVAEARRALAVWRASRQGVA